MGFCQGQAGGQAQSKSKYELSSPAGSPSASASPHKETKVDVDVDVDNDVDADVGDADSVYRMSCIAELLAPYHYAPSSSADTAPTTTTPSSDPLFVRWLSKAAAGRGRRKARAKDSSFAMVEQLYLAALLKHSGLWEQAYEVHVELEANIDTIRDELVKAPASGSGSGGGGGRRRRNSKKLGAKSKLPKVSPDLKVVWTSVLALRKELQQSRQRLSSMDSDLESPRAEETKQDRASMPKSKSKPKSVALAWPAPTSFDQYLQQLATRLDFLLRVAPVQMQSNSEGFTHALRSLRSGPIESQMTTTWPSTLSTRQLKLLQGLLLPLEQAMTLDPRSPDARPATGHQLQRVRSAGGTAHAFLGTSADNNNNNNSNNRSNATPLSPTAEEDDEDDEDEFEVVSYVSAVVRRCKS